MVQCTDDAHSFSCLLGSPRKTLRQYTLPRTHGRGVSRFSTLPQRTFLACVDSRINAFITLRPRHEASDFGGG